MIHKDQAHLFFNKLWKGVCEGEGDNAPTNTTSYKELAIWNNKDNKSYALIVASISEELIFHVITLKNSFEALKKLIYLYDSHWKLELV